MKVVHSVSRTWLFPSMSYVLTTKNLYSPLHLSNKSIMQPYLQSGDGPIVLVLAPTRELALQIKQECDKFGASSEIKNTVVYGGVPKSTQVRDLRYITNILFYFLFNPFYFQNLHSFFLKSNSLNIIIDFANFFCVEMV